MLYLPDTQHRVFRHLERASRIGPFTVSQFVTLLVTLLPVLITCRFVGWWWPYKLVFAAMVIALMTILMNYAAAKRRTPWRMAKSVYRALRTARRYGPAKGQCRYLVIISEQPTPEEGEI